MAAKVGKLLRAVFFYVYKYVYVLKFRGLLNKQKKMILKQNKELVWNNNNSFKKQLVLTGLCEKNQG